MEQECKDQLSGFSYMKGEAEPCPYDPFCRVCQRRACQLHTKKIRNAAEEDADPVADWLDGIIHPESLDELPWDLDERRANMHIRIESLMRRTVTAIC